MKKITSIITITAGIICINNISATFKPLTISLTVNKETLPYTLENDDTISDFIHFFFMEEKKEFVSCYALVAFKSNNYLNPIGIVKGEPYTTVKKWEYISLPTNVNGVNLKYIGLLDNKLTLITQERTTFGSNYYSSIYQYNPLKKSAFNFLSPVTLENPGWDTLYKTAPNTILSKFSGSTITSWWIYIKGEYPNPNIISRVFKDKNSLKIEKPSDVLWITTTPDNVYCWTIAPQKNNSSNLTLLVEDLADTDEFKEATLVNLSNTMPRQIKNLIALNNEQAYCIDSSGNLYEINNKGNVTRIPTNIGSINNIANLNKQLVVAHNNQLYIYEPKIKNPDIQKTEVLRNVSAPKNFIAHSPNTTIIPVSQNTKPQTIKPTTQTEDTEKNSLTKSPIEQLTLAKKQGVAAPLNPMETQPSEEIDFEYPSTHISFTQPQQSYLMRFYKSPQMQSILKRTVGNNFIYNKFLKSKNALETEQEALEKDPRPWEKFIPKPTRYERAQYWLFKKTNGWLGSDSAENYPDEAQPIFPDTKEGKRAKLLHTLFKRDRFEYIPQWLNKTSWDKLDDAVKQWLRAANNGRLPRFGEFWLQERLQDRLQKLPAQETPPIKNTN